MTFITRESRFTEGGGELCKSDIAKAVLQWTSST